MFILDIWIYLAENALLDYTGTCALLHSNHLIRQALLDHTTHKDALFLSATRYGYTSIFEHLYPHVDPSLDDNQALCDATAHGHIAMVKRLLADERVDPTVRHQTPFLNACRHGHVAIVRDLLQDTRVGPSSDSFVCTDMAASNGNADMLHLLIKHDRLQQHLSVAKLTATLHKVVTKSEDEACVRVLLQHSNTHVTPEIVKKVCKGGNNTILKLLLPHIRNVHHKYLYNACYFGHIDVVRTLLTSSSLCWSIHGRTKAMDMALQQNHPAIAQYILKTQQPIAIAYREWDIFRESASGGHLAVLKQLLSRYRIHPGMHNQIALRNAAAGGHLEVVVYLLRNKRVLPQVLENDAFQAAAANGHLAICKHLMQDARVDPHACNERARRLARQNRHMAVVQLLTRENIIQPLAPQARQRAKLQQALFQACRRDNASRVRAVLAKDTLWDAYDDIRVAKRLAKKRRQRAILDVLQAYQNRLDQKQGVAYARRKLKRWLSRTPEKGYDKDEAAKYHTFEHRSQWFNPRHKGYVDVHKLLDDREEDRKILPPLQEALAQRKLAEWQKQLSVHHARTILNIRREQKCDDNSFYHICLKQNRRDKNPNISVRLHRHVAHNRSLLAQPKEFFIGFDSPRDNRDNRDKFRHIYGGIGSGQSSRVDSLLREPVYREKEEMAPRSVEAGDDGDPWDHVLYDRETMHEPCNTREYQGPDEEKDDLSSLF